MPISVDGMLIVASTAMVEDKRRGRPVRWSARVAFVAGVAASVAANIAAAHPSVGARIVAAWPALAMLLVVEILSRARSVGDQPGIREPSPEGSAGNTGGHVSGGGAAGGGAFRTQGRPSAGRDSLDRVDVRSGATAARRLRPRRRARSTVETVVRLREERPDASLADIAAEVGVSERHVRRLLTSQAGARPTSHDESYL